MKKKEIKKNRGFVLLFVIVISSIILAITLGVANIALKEIKFSTEARSTNEAFFAADTGAECALYNDKSTVNSFRSPSPANITCNGNSVPLNGTSPSWNFILSGLGSGRQGCAKVTVDKSGSCGSATCIVSKGYNDGGGVAGSCLQGQSSIERQLEVSY